MGPKLLPLTQQPDWPTPRKIWEKGEILGGPVTWLERSKITTATLKLRFSLSMNQNAQRLLHQPLARRFHLLSFQVYLVGPI